jgi:hypothetical protein
MVDTSSSRKSADRNPKAFGEEKQVTRLRNHSSLFLFEFQNPKHLQKPKSQSFMLELRIWSGRKRPRPSIKVVSDLDLGTKKN